MAYRSTSTIIARHNYGGRPGPSGLDGWLDKLKQVGTGALDLYGKTAGAAAETTALRESNAAMAAALAARQQPPARTGLYLGIGAAALATVLLLRKRGG